MSYKEVLKIAQYQEGKARAINRFVKSTPFYEMMSYLPTETVIQMIRANDLDGLKELVIGTSSLKAELIKEALALGIKNPYGYDKAELSQAILIAKENIQ